MTEKWAHRRPAAQAGSGLAASGPAAVTRHNAAYPGPNNAPPFFLRAKGRARFRGVVAGLLLNRHSVAQVEAMDNLAVLILDFDFLGQVDPAAESIRAYDRARLIKRGGGHGFEARQLPSVRIEQNVGSVPQMKEIALHWRPHASGGSTSVSQSPEPNSIGDRLPYHTRLRRARRLIWISGVHITFVRQCVLRHVMVRSIAKG